MRFFCKVICVIMIYRFIICDNYGFFLLMVILDMVFYNKFVFCVVNNCFVIMCGRILLEWCCLLCGSMVYRRDFCDDGYFNIFLGNFLIFS